MNARNAIDFSALAQDIKSWGRELGFEQVGIADVELDEAEKRLSAWLERGFHGKMGYMARHGTRRSRPVTGSWRRLVSYPKSSQSAKNWTLPGQPMHP